MLLTLPLVPVFMWLIGSYTGGQDARAVAGAAPLSSHFLDVVRGLPTLRAFGRGTRRGGDRRRGQRALPRGDDGNASDQLPVRLRARAGGDDRRGAGRGHGRRPARRRQPRAAGGADRDHPRARAVSPVPPARRRVPRERGRARGGRADVRAARRPGGGRRRRSAARAQPGDARRCASSGSRSRTRPVRARCSTGSTSSCSPGEVVALVGESGAGKSTVAALLLGLLSPTGGADHGRRRRPVRVPARRVAAARRLGAPASDAVPRRRSPTTSGSETPRRRRGGGPRRPRGSPAPTSSSAALPDGYDTLVGDGERSLSPGERRRIGLARAFVRDAPLVILDEPTADLDPRSVSIVADAVRRLQAGRTMLVIAHRPELVRSADRVVRLIDGAAVSEPVEERGMNDANAARALLRLVERAALARWPGRGAARRADGRCSASG